jgi:hypothetical protein
LGVAEYFAKELNTSPRVIFEIFVNKENDPPTNVELPSNWSYWNEAEVLLMPFFCFQVISIT